MTNILGFFDPDSRNPGIFEVPEIQHHKFSYILGSILWTFRRCAFKLEDWLQRYWHKWQANGFSPVWILMWICKLAYDLARKLHIWQAWGFVSDLEVFFWYWNNIGYISLREIIIVIFFSPNFSPSIFKKKAIESMILLFIKVFEKNSYILGSILWTFRWCLFKLEDRLQQNVHKWQANGFSPVWIIMWIFKRALFLTRKLHIWQAWGFASQILWYWNNIE